LAEYLETGTRRLPTAAGGRAQSVELLLGDRHADSARLSLVDANAGVVPSDARDAAAGPLVRTGKKNTVRVALVRAVLARSHSKPLLDMQDV
jgi:hypothetical protein